MTDATPTRPEARNPRGFADRRGRDLTAERRLVARVRDHVGEMTIDLEEVEAIERDAAGKFRAVISSVTP